MKSILVFLTTIILAQFSWGQGRIDGRFETRRITEPLTFDEPENWTTSNSLCQQIGITSNVDFSDDACAGDCALRLETTADTICMPFPATAIRKDAINFKPFALTGYYKAEFMGQDYAGIKVTFHSDRGVVGWGAIDLTQSTNIYSWFEIPIEYLHPAVVPDSFTLSIFSSQDVEVSGTVVYVDDLGFEEVIDVTIPNEPTFITRITPNPATDEILVVVPNDLGMLRLRIYDESGQPMESEKFEDQIRVPVYEYIEGMYIYEIWKSDRTLYDRGRFMVGKHGQHGLR
jgi:hypothetical protein